GDVAIELDDDLGPLRKRSQPVVKRPDDRRRATLVTGRRNRLEPHPGVRSGERFDGGPGPVARAGVDDDPGLRHSALPDEALGHPADVVYLVEHGGDHRVLELRHTEIAVSSCSFSSVGMRALSSTTLWSRNGTLTSSERAIDA